MAQAGDSTAWYGSRLHLDIERAAVVNAELHHVAPLNGQGRSRFDVLAGSRAQRP